MNARALLRWRPATVQGQAALLMLGSTSAFALMAIAIRYASATVPTTEVAFFRNFFGLLALLPITDRGAPDPGPVLRAAQVTQE